MTSPMVMIPRRSTHRPRLGPVTVGLALFLAAPVALAQPAESPPAKSTKKKSLTPAPPPAPPELQRKREIVHQRLAPGNPADDAIGVRGKGADRAAIVREALESGKIRVESS